MADQSSTTLSDEAAAGKTSSVFLPLLVMTVVYLVYAWDRVVVPVELVEIQHAYGLSFSIGSLIASVFTFGLAATTLPAGALLAKWGTRSAMVAGAIIFSVCTAYTPLGYGIADLLATRIAAGVGEGFYNVAMYSYLGQLTERYRGAAAGMAGTLFGVGLLTGPPVITWLQIGFGDWRAPFFALAAIGLVGALALRILLTSHNTPSIKTTAPVLPRLLSLLTWRNIVVCIIASVNSLGLYAFLSVYVTYLRSVWHVDQSTASYVFSAYGLGGLLGGIPLGYLADRIGRRPFLMVALILCGIAGTSIFIVAPLIVPSVIANLVFGILLNGIYSNCFALIQDHVDRPDIPIATGLVGAVAFTTASFSGWLIVTAANAVNWQNAALLIYLVPYLACFALLTISPQVGRLQTRAGG